MKLKKLAVMVLAAAMAAAMLLIPASAASIADTAKTRHNGESFSIKLADGKDHDYKIKLTKNGDLKINLTSATAGTNIQVFDSDGNKLKYSSSESKATSGSLDYDYWNGEMFSSGIGR